MYILFMDEILQRKRMTNENYNINTPSVNFFIDSLSLPL